MYELLLKSNTLYILSEILSSIYVHWWFFCHIVFSLRSTTLNDIHLQQAPRLLIIHDNGKALKELLYVRESVKFPIWRDEECSRKVESVFNRRQFVKRGVYRASKKTDIDLIRSITIQNNSQKNNQMIFRYRFGKTFIQRPDQYLHLTFNVFYFTLEVPAFSGA